MLIAAVGIAYFCGMALGPGHYYWPSDAHYTNVAPISTRMSWLILACLPFMMAIGAKANLITILTGISHEKLNFWHRWIGRVMWIMAMIHGFSYITARAKQGDLQAAFHSSSVLLTGTISLVSLTMMVGLSVSWIRNRWYEIFKAMHFFFVASFLTFVMIHSTYILTTWDYYIATLVLYATCFIFTLYKTYISHGLQHVAHLCYVSPHTIRIAIKSRGSWRPGQHMYLRFPRAAGVHGFASHPFTICTMSAAKSGDTADMVFFVQPRGGMTRYLAEMANSGPDAQLRVLLDGPYGGLPGRWFQGFDRAVVIAGGSGCGFTLGLLEHWILQRSSKAALSNKLQIILTARDDKMHSWYTDELQRILAIGSHTSVKEIPGLSISTYRTTPQSPDSLSSNQSVSDNLDLEIGDLPSPMTICDKPDPLGLTLAQGRPDINSIVCSAVRERGVSVGIVVCGPTSLVDAVVGAAANAQTGILFGQQEFASEVWLHKEAFS